MKKTNYVLKLELNPRLAKQLMQAAHEANMSPSQYVRALLREKFD